MKLIKITIVVFILAAFSTSCAEDPVSAVTYKVTIYNEAATDQDVYLMTDLDNTGYVSQGTVLQAGTKEVTGLIISVKYTFGFIEKGGDPADITKEIDVTNNDPAKLDYEITILP